jgi:hypothetical protein
MALAQCSYGNIILAVSLWINLADPSIAIFVDNALK